MSDLTSLISELREGCSEDAATTDRLMDKAADEIERLLAVIDDRDAIIGSRLRADADLKIYNRTQIERLRTALQQIADEDSGIVGGIAWAALENRP